MRPRALPPMLALTLTVSSFAALPPAAGLPALPGALVVEGEHRVRDAGPCGGGETMTVWRGFTGESGSGVLAYVNHGCWAEWNVALPQPATLTLVAAHGTWGECRRWDVAVDGSSSGQARMCGHPGLVVTPTQVVDPVQVVVPAGAHVVRVTMAVSLGPLSGNGALDRLEFRPAV